MINGQQMLTGMRPAYSKMNKQVEHKAGSGKLYSLMMGREFKPDQYAIMLDFDNKIENDTESGLDFVDE